MRYSKIFTKNITITDSKLLFTGNLDATILEIFNNNWKGKCMNGVFVVSGDRVIKRSQCVINNRSLQAHCTISVELEVTVIVYEPGDVIIGTVVTIDASGDFILTSDTASMSVGTNDILKSVRVGDKLPIYVVQVQYTLGRPKLSVIGVPFVALKNVLTYNINDVDNDNTISLDGFFDTIKDLETQLAQYAKNNPKSYNYFTKMLSNKLNNGQLLSNLTTETGIVSRPRHVGGVYVKNAINIKNAINAESTIVSQSRIIVAEQFLSSYIKELATTITLIENYDTEELIKEHSHIFKIYKSTI